MDCSVSAVPCQGSVVVPLAKRGFTVVDKEDAERAAAYRWYLSGRGYAFSPGGPSRKSIFLHRFLVDAPEGMEVDHIDGDKLNNRKSNLRVCSHAENMWNARRQHRVGVRRRGGRHVAQISIGGKRVCLGTYDSEDDAFAAYDAAVRLCRDEHAFVNDKDGVRHLGDVISLADKAHAKSGFIGVYWHEQSGKWASRVRVAKKTVCLGYFDTKEYAAVARDTAIKLLGLGFDLQVLCE